MRNENLPKTIIVVDVETAGNFAKPYVYDIGYIIAREENGQYNKIVEKSYIVSDIYNNLELFSTAYYNDKRELYENKKVNKQIQKFRREIVFRKMQEDIEKYDVDMMLAYNESFDSGAFNFTSERYFLLNPLSGLPTNCIWKIAQNTLCITDSYKEFCDKHELYTDSLISYKSSAEVVYAYLTDNKDFEEEHTGLEDCKIELDILNFLLANYEIDLNQEYKNNRNQLYRNVRKKLTVQLINNGDKKEYTFQYDRKWESKQKSLIRLTRNS